MKISATVITFNEENRLARCLESLHGLVDETIVVDADSQDGTREMAAVHGARVFRRPWTNYSDQKNFASAQASYDWILSLDADECLSSSLHQKLMDLKKAKGFVEAYAFRRKAFYLGRWIHHSGWYPDYKTRLYLKDKAHWEGEFVHETLVVNGRIHRIGADLLHYTCDSLSEHVRSLDRYTTLAAQDLQTRGEQFRVFDLIGSPIATFLKTYLLNAGFRDGVQGCFIAVLAAYYNFLKYGKLWELKHNSSETDRNTCLRE